MKNKLFF